MFEKMYLKSSPKILCE